jgi:hypothetical protein
MAESGKGKLVGFWILTGLIAFSQGMTGVMDLVGMGPGVEGLANLGYPSYMLLIIGAWKLLGAVALAAPGFQKIKEFAYAGFFFDFTGATASHLLNGDGFTGGDGGAIAASVLTGMLIGSYLLHPKGR